MCPASPYIDRIYIDIVLEGNMKENIASVFKCVSQIYEIVHVFLHSY